MRNLEQMIGMHRRLKGMNHSTKEDVHQGVFEIPMSHSPWVGKRMFVCTAHTGPGIEMVSIIGKEWTSPKRAINRPPTALEAGELLRFFFHQDDMVFQQYNIVADPRAKKKKAVRIWRCEDGGLPKVLPEVDGLNLVWK